MVITRETDYALRILRALLDGKLHTAGQIAQDELLPQAFAYKILKKLEKAGLVEVVRGTAGGCRLSADLIGTSLYDLMKAMGERGNLSSCMDPAYQCPWRSCHGGCTVHCKLAEIQNKLDEELRAVNSDYDAKRRTTLERQRLTVVERGTFLAWMRARGKNKVPRLVNDRRVADEILAFQTEQTL